MKNKKFTVIGGDLRSVKLANALAADGNRVYIYGFNKAGFDLGLKESEDLGLAIDASDVIVGPIPCSNDEDNINAPFHSEKILITDVFKTMNKNQLFMAGRISDKVTHLCQVFNVYRIDLLEREELSVLNAIPTAEGAIQIAMEELPITLHNAKVLILGYGRIGKILAKMLAALGSHVYVEARKYADIAWIKSYGYEPVLLKDLKDYLPQMDTVMNTVPHLVLDETLLKVMNRECLLIDLASKPGGIDFEKAKTLGLKVIWALSLPGKVAPITTAGFIKDTIYNIIEELGV